MLAPRQPVTPTPYAIQSLNAATASGLSSACVGCVTGAQIGSLPTNSGSYIQNSATLQAASNFNISGNGFIGGNLGIGTAAPRAKFHVNGSSWFQGDTTPLPASAGKGVVIGFGGEQGYISAFDYGTFTPKNLLLNLTGGTVGIGTATPFAGYKLDVNGQALFRTGGSGGGADGVIAFHTPNSETGLTISGNGSNRADLRFNGSTLKLVASEMGIPPATNGLVITTTGNVGIGVENPGVKLDVRTNDTIGIRGGSNGDAGVQGFSISSDGVQGFSSSANVGAAAIYGQGTSGGAFAGRFYGSVSVSGTLSKGGGSFKIDHPLDPENKYLYHSFVESPDMMNIYNGNATTDENGIAVVTLPEWFESLNREFRYQLTVVGQFAQAIVAQKVKENRFVIRTSEPNVEVSWQVTGIRQDAWANKNRIPVEEMKSEIEKGYYLHPETFDQPEEKGMEWACHPALMKQQKEARERRQREQNNKDAGPAARPNNR